MANKRLTGAVAVFSLLVVVVFLAATAVAAESSGAPGWLEPSDDVVSDHIAWAKPASDGPIRVLFITYRHGMREIVELSQRFDLQREVFCTNRPDTFADNARLRLRGTSTQEREERLRRKLNEDYHVIVIGNIKWDVLPQWARKSILEKVGGGTGLVAHLYGDADEQIRTVFAEPLPAEVDPPQPALPFAGLPAFRDNSSYSVFRNATIQPAVWGTGRAVLLKGFFCPPGQMLTPGLIDPAPHVYRIHYDYYLALAGHMIRWAAGKSPAVTVVQARESSVIGTDVDNSKSLTFTLAARAAGEVHLRCAVRHSDYRTVWFAGEKDARLNSGQNQVSFDLSGIPAGSYFADLWVCDDGKILDFGSVLYRVASASHIKQVRLDATVTSPDGLIRSFRKTDPIRGAVVLARSHKNQTVLIAQRDNFGRLVATASTSIRIEGESCEIPFALRSPQPLSIGQQLEVTLSRPGRVLDVKREMFFYADLYLPKDEVAAIVWAEPHPPSCRPTSYLFPVRLGALRNAGFDMSLLRYDYDTDYYFSQACIDSDLRILSMAHGRPRAGGGAELVSARHFKITSNDLGDVRTPCFADPVFLGFAADFYGEIARYMGPLSVEDYNTGDECMLVKHNENQDVCFCDICAKGFQAHVEKEYGTLDKLNREYDSSYTSWADVMPVNLEQARKTGEIPRWIDHRRHVDSVWAGFFANARAAIRRHIPQARVGYEGSNDPGHLPKTIGLGGVDYWKLARSMDVNGMYYFPLQLDTVRSFSDPGCLIGGGWFGGYPQMMRAGKDPLHHRWWVWRSLLHGANSMWVFISTHFTCDTWAIQRPDFALYDYFKPTAETFRTIARGPGKLLLSAKRENDRIAMLYSPSSMLLATFTTDLSKEWDVIETMPMVFDESGFQYRLISSTQLEEGILKSDGFEVLYLPYCQALSPREVEVIREFAAAGGTVIADLRPAVADDHGKPYPEGALDELFGVKQNTARPKPKVTKVALKGKVGQLEGDLPETHVDTSLAVTTGKALAAAGDTPAVIVNRYSNGLAVLLNLTFADYIAYRGGSFDRFASPEKAQQSKALLQGVLAMAGRAPPIGVDPYVPGAHVYRFALDGAKIAGLLWHAPAWLPGMAYITIIDDFTQPLDSQGKPIRDVYDLEQSGSHRIFQQRAAVEEAAKRRETVSLHFDAASHLYDVLQGEYLGHLQSIEQVISPGSLRLVAALPYKVDKIKLTLPERVRKSAELRLRANVVTASGKTRVGTHIFRLELLNPQGDSAEHYARNVRAEGGACTATFNLALDETPGMWHATVTDVMTGVSAEQQFEVY